MQLYCISENKDTLVGMRLSGINGTLVATADEAIAALEQTKKEDDIGIVLVTAGVVGLIPHYIDSMKLTCPRPIVSQIPSPDDTDAGPSLDRYIREAIGL